MVFLPSDAAECAASLAIAAIYSSVLTTIALVPPMLIRTAPLRFAIRITGARGRSNWLVCAAFAFFFAGTFFTGFGIFGASLRD